MADNADFATDLLERRMESALAHRRLPTAPAANDECEECGDEIPAARREAVPWANTCIECQEINERKRRHVR